MNQVPDRAVFDCNVFLQALGNPLGPAGRCVEEALAGRFSLIVNEQILEELISVAERPELARKLRILPTRLESLLEQLRSKAVFVEDAPVVFSYRRDPDDVHYVNLAVAANAFLIVSRDKDLLSLMTETNVEGRTLRHRYPGFRVLTPPEFLRLLDANSEQ
jgi:putative PIN family toxin of toxin-antitoxin system